MKPYSPGKPIDEVKRELGLADVVKLASNENPLGPSPKAVAAVSAAAGAMHLYPDAAAFALKEKLAGHLRLPMNQVMVGNGSDELIHYLGQVFLEGPDTSVVIGDPTFVRYEASGQLSASRVVKVPLDASWTHDARAMADRFDQSTRLVYIANPNNPTGTIVKRQDVDWLVGRLPSGALLVLDEAYFEFAADVPDFPNAADYVREGAPVCGLRTFSKAYGLAGIRIGAGFASAEVVDLVDRIREPFNANLLAQAAAIAALDDQAHVASTVAANRRQLARVEALAASLGLSVVPTYANFVCIDLGRPAEPVFQALLQKGIITRSGHVLGMPAHLRVSLGTDAEMAAFEAAFRKVLA